MLISNLKIKNSHSDNLLADFRFNPEGENLPLLIFVHGFKGFKDWGCFPYMLNKFSESGIFAISFNFSYNGIGEEETGITDFTRLDLFAKNTFSRELDDLSSVIEYLMINKNSYNYNFDNIIIAGHSRGGGISIIKTAEDKRIKKLITLASVSEFNCYSEERKSDWKKAGYISVLNTRTKQYMKMDYSLIEDLENNYERLNIKKAVSNIKIPYLIIHGTEDLAVDFSEAEILYSYARNTVPELLLIENTGHTFGTSHPFSGTNNIFEKIIDKMISFIKLKD